MLLNNDVNKPIRPEAQKKILDLLAQVHEVYMGERARFYGGTCDICGIGATQTRTHVLPARRVVQGFWHRPETSPQLCHRHASGWERSCTPFMSQVKRSDAEIDLHFAHYLATQLLKESKNEHRTAAPCA